ncbi:MAG: NUDIX domain-containing protein [Parcubacteria group bacterium]|jgi:8-oxo-dGTP pyrophosphatase MutT (NUDIX family)
MKKIICRDIHGEQSEHMAQDLIFRPSVYAVIICDGKVLLSRQWDGYDFPGGGIKKGERIYEALRREVHEEVGIVIKESTLISCTDDFFVSPRDGRLLHSILMYYACDRYSGDPHIDNLVEDEKNYISGFEWVDIQSLNAVKFYNGVDSIALVQKSVRLLQNNRKNN